MKTAVVTGASSGIGRAVARALLTREFHVIGTSRNISAIADPLPGVEYRELDLTESESIQSFVNGLEHIDIDVLVNNAGESQCGPIEELPIDAVRRLFQLNVFGPVELTQRVLPGMRVRGRGTVVNVGSMLASFPLAYRSSYAGTKAAIKAFSTAARYELKPFGIDITTVEPGSIDTGLSTRRTKYCGPHSPYQRDFTTVIAKLDAKEGQGISPDTVARTVLKAVEAKRTRPGYAVGSNAPVVLLAQRMLPRTVMETLTARTYGLPSRHSEI
ncbi:SDR family oxidoreductase (plasmid) [Rhodococcus qingshengii]|uniref:SDR family oxidoreductase n=1 Tax=Rhodococcus qingshengii TaxID=334542 RepID=UPI0021122AB9|nr:SDR family oxidoreductase [Rhodococcus qingshengii]UUE28708.1 SDR family oxidoreductase [Rhodococcus qingshengii]